MLPKSRREFQVDWRQEAVERVLAQRIYVMNDAFTTATWFYAGAVDEKTMPPDRRVTTPTAVAAGS
jgi:hypothetical protein